MTTFTQIPGGEKPCISLNPKNVISKIEPESYKPRRGDYDHFWLCPARMIAATKETVLGTSLNDQNIVYSGFTEHMGRCIYGGLYDPSSPFADENGFRKDVIDIMKELRVPAVRYPGGNFTATYRWQDGVGPREKRPKRPELAWLGTETNQFGTDEFMKWCKLVGTEPYLCFNMGTGTLEDALAWLEYCNGKGDTHYANLRRQNGHEEPYNVKYWAVGNETWGDWQVEQTTQEVFAEKSWQWAKALKLLDPTIQLVLCGNNGITSWDWHIINRCVRHWQHGLVGEMGSGQLFDMHALHMYTTSEEHVVNALNPLAAELAIQAAARMIDVARIENEVPPHIPKPKICFDEWNVWDPKRARGDQGAEEKYTLSDALAVSVFLGVFIRQSQHLGMCNIAQSLNVISPLLTDPSDPSAPLLKQTTLYPYLLFSRFMRGHTLAVHLRCQEFTGSMVAGESPDRRNYGWLRSLSRTPWLDVSACVGVGTEELAAPEVRRMGGVEFQEGEGRYVCVAVTNVHEERAFEVEFEVEGLKGKEVRTYTVGGQGTGPWVSNTRGKEEVGVVEGTWKADGSYEFPPLSLTLLRWKL